MAFGCNKQPDIPMNGCIQHSLPTHARNSLHKSKARAKAEAGRPQTSRRMQTSTRKAPTRPLAALWVALDWALWLKLTSTGHRECV